SAIACNPLLEKSFCEKTAAGSRAAYYYLVLHVTYIVPQVEFFHNTFSSYLYVILLRKKWIGNIIALTSILGPYFIPDET
ncbi:MAG: hypothetical protein SOT60_12405, partial [Bilifractor sp.]|nr:hypothetical protein [Bilifractor sp.]